MLDHLPQDRQLAKRLARDVRAATRARARAELAQNSVEGRMLEVQKSTLEMAGSSRLDQIRASMAGNQIAAAPTAAALPLTSAAPAADADADADKTT